MFGKNLAMAARELKLKCKILILIKLFKFSGFLIGKLFFSENFCTGEIFNFWPLLDFFGGCVLVFNILK